MIIDHDLPEFCGAAAREYQYLELKVGQLITRVCAPFCRECIECCCKKDFCAEAIDSFWLNLMWQMGDHNILQYDAAKGWLSSAGCRLTVGRPPVCYEFLCGKILDNISKRPQLHRIKDISKLIRFAGKKH